MVNSTDCKISSFQSQCSSILKKIICIISSIHFTLFYTIVNELTFSLKSTPIVASLLSRNLPPQNRNVRHVLPTLASPITIILKIRLCCCCSFFTGDDDDDDDDADLRLRLVVASWLLDEAADEWADDRVFISVSIDDCCCCCCWLLKLRFRSCCCCCCCCCFCCWFILRASDKTRKKEKNYAILYLVASCWLTWIRLSISHV